MIIVFGHAVKDNRLTNHSGQTDIQLITLTDLQGKSKSVTLNVHQLNTKADIIIVTVNLHEQEEKMN